MVVVMGVGGWSLLPTKLLEYTSLAVPTVCARLPAVEDYFPEDSLAYFTPGDSDDLAHKLDAVANRLVIALITTGGLIGSSLIGIFAKAGPQFLGVNVISVVGFGLSGILGVWLLWGVIRSGRL